MHIHAQAHAHATWQTREARREKIKNMAKGSNHCLFCGVCAKQGSSRCAAAAVPDWDAEWALYTVTAQTMLLDTCMENAVR